MWICWWPRMWFLSSKHSVFFYSSHLKIECVQPRYFARIHVQCWVSWLLVCEQMNGFPWWCWQRWDRVRGGKWWTYLSNLSVWAGRVVSLCDRRQLDWQLMDRTQRRMLLTRTQVEHWTNRTKLSNPSLYWARESKFFLREFLSLLTRRMSVHLIYKRHIGYASWIS